MTATMVLFWAGMAGGLLAGVLIFRAQVFLPGQPAFESLTLAALAAGILTLVRQDRPGEAFALVLAFGGVRFLLTPDVRMSAALTGLFLSLGLFLVALIFDMMARAGWRFGKFLIVGPLVGGLLLALAPITERAGMNAHNAVGLMTFRLAFGVLIGEGVALGIELAEISLGRGRAQPVSSDGDVG